MPDIEIDFDDVSLEPTHQVDAHLESNPKAPETTPEKVDEIPDPATPPKPEGKKRGPKPKDATPPSQPAVPDPKAEISTDPIDPAEEEDEAPETDNPEETFIQTMAKKIGIEIPEGMEFTDDEDGLIEFNEYVADQRADEKLNGYFDNLPPIAGEFFDYLQMLGEDATNENIKAFFTTVNPEIDYTAVDLSDEQTQKAVMKTFYKKNGYTDADIKEELDDLEVAGTLKRQAEKASKILAAKQKEELGLLLEQEKRADLQRKQSTQRFFNEVRGVLESGKVNNFTIPTTEKRSIYEYDTSGQFGKDLNEILKDPAKRVELSIAVKNKFNLNKYIQTAAATQRTNSLRDKVNKSGGKMKSGTGYGTVTNSDIDWDQQ